MTSTSKQLGTVQNTITKKQRRWWRNLKKCLQGHSYVVLAESFRPACVESMVATISVWSGKMWRVLSDGVQHPGHHRSASWCLLSVLSLWCISDATSLSNVVKWCACAATAAISFRRTSFCCSMCVSIGRRFAGGRAKEESSGSSKAKCSVGDKEFWSGGQGDATMR